MTDLEEIPAASLLGLDWESIRARAPVVASRLQTLGEALNTGTETNAMFVELCELLLLIGEREKAGELLIPNGEDDGPTAVLIMKHFPKRVERFNDAIRRFQSQFGVELTLRESTGAFRKRFSLRPTGSRIVPEKEMRRLRRATACRVEFTATFDDLICNIYDDRGGLVLDWGNGNWIARDEVGMKREAVSWSSDD